jgi:hypothetical protein
VTYSGAARPAALGAIASALAFAAATASLARPAEADEPAREKNAVGTELFEFGLAMAAGGRRFTYSDPVSANIRDYSVFGAVMPELHLAFYPAADTGITFARDVGFELTATSAFGLSSQSSDGTSVGSSYDRLDAMVRARFFPAGRTGTSLGLAGGASLLRFSYDASGSLADQVPGAAYESLRLAGDARAPIGRGALTIAIAYDAPLTAGDVYDRFTGSTVGGIDVRLGASFLVGAGVEVRAAASYTRFFYAFAPVPGDTYVAGGALDEFFGLSLGAAYAY